MMEDLPCQMSEHNISYSYQINIIIKQKVSQWNKTETETDLSITKVLNMTRQVF